MFNNDKDITKSQFKAFAGQLDKQSQGHENISLYLNKRTIMALKSLT